MKKRERKREERRRKERRKEEVKRGGSCVGWEVGTRKQLVEVYGLFD